MALQAKRLEDGSVEVLDGGGMIVRCFLDGRIALYEVPKYGGSERLRGNYPTICAALQAAQYLRVTD